MTGWNNLFLVAFAEIKTSKIYLCTKTWVNDDAHSKKWWKHINGT